MITYEQLSAYLKKQHEYPVSFRKNYFVIMVRGTKYHITVFQDQWNDYEKVTTLPFHLFHISSDSEENRCSSYFWVDRNTYKIRRIPGEFFKYNQPSYDFYSSTRSRCQLREISPLLKVFQRILNKIGNIEKN